MYMYMYPCAHIVSQLNVQSRRLNEFTHLQPVRYVPLVQRGVGTLQQVWLPAPGSSLSHPRLLATRRVGCV